MTKGYARRKGGRSSLPFVKLEIWVLRTAAWADLDAIARCLYLELKQRFNGRNNGMIGLGCREAATALGCSADTASRAFKALEEHGFIITATSSTFNQKRLPRQWLQTALSDDRTGRPSGKEFTRCRAAISDLPPQATAKVIALPRRSAA